MSPPVSGCGIPPKSGPDTRLIDSLAKFIRNRSYLHFPGLLPRHCRPQRDVVIDPELRVGGHGPGAFVLAAGSAELDIGLEVGAAAEEAAVIIDLACESVGEFEVTLLVEWLASYKHKIIGHPPCLARTADYHN